MYDDTIRVTIETFPLETNLQRKLLNLDKCMDVISWIAIDNSVVISADATLSRR